MFDFRNLITKYGKPLIVVNDTEGDYDYDNGGEFVPYPIQEIGVTAALLPIKSSELSKLNTQYSEGGRYTTDDRKLYIHMQLKVGQKVIKRNSGQDDVIYTRDAELDYSDYANGLYIYIVRRAAK